MFQISRFLHYISVVLFTQVYFCCRLCTVYGIVGIPASVPCPFEQAPGSAAQLSESQKHSTLGEIAVAGRESGSSGIRKPFLESLTDVGREEGFTSTKGDSEVRVCMG